MFISDLHLQDLNEPAVFAFKKLLTAAISNADALYILGDFFNTWIGDDDDSEFIQMIINLFKTATSQNFPIYFMHGNRDFLVGSCLAAQCGFHMLPDPTVIHLYGQRLLLMHGDSLCTFDHLHQLWFKFSRHRFNHKISTLIPLAWRRRLATFLRNRSQQHQRHKTHYQLDVNPTKVTTLLDQYSASILIHGHTHRPGIHLLGQQNQLYKNINHNDQKDNYDSQPKFSRTRVVLGAWHDSASVLYFYENGEYELKDLPFKKA